MTSRVHGAVVIGAVLSVIAFINFVVLKPAFFGHLLFSDKDQKSTTVSEMLNKGMVSDVSILQAAEAYKRERNELSKMMNTLKQEFAAMSCEMMGLKGKLGMVRMIETIKIYMVM